MVWKADGPQGNEAGKVMWELPQYTRGLVLDIGCGPHKAFPHFYGVDNRKDTELFKIQMNPEMTVQDASELPLCGTKHFDAVFSSHLLEHIEDYKKALKEWWRVIKVGGHLCLYLPHKDFYPNIGQPGANHDHKHDFVPKDILDAMDGYSWDLVRNEDRNEGIEYSFFMVFRKQEDGEAKKYSYKLPRPEKSVAIILYGGWGDNLQMASILPEFKKQGYHVTLYTTPNALEVVREDPNIDAVYFQDRDQVPNQSLPDFWQNELKKYTKFVNLCESVEANWLVLKDNSRSNWPTSVHDKYMRQTNYVQFQHELAEVPYTTCNTRFYETEDERRWAAKLKRDTGGKPTILWALTGSSVHKTWPHIDQIFARVMMSYPDAHIFLVGDKDSGVLVDQWEKEPRIHRMMNKWTIRETLSFANQADLIVGPETGVMSAVGMQPMPNIVFMSHSAPENLTRDWNNTFSLFSTKTACYPCHKLHYSWKTCVQNQDQIDGKDAPWAGAAQCQVDLPPEACWDALTRALNPLVEKKKIRVKVFPVTEEVREPAVIVPEVKTVALPFPKKKDAIANAFTS